MTIWEVNTAGLWESWQRLYPVYRTLGHELIIDSQPCRVLEENGDVLTAEAVTEAQAWFELMDERIRAHHLRQFAQTSSSMTERALTDLLIHIVNKKKRTDDDRDKVDFTIVQLLSFRIPSRLALESFTLADAISVLEPALGSCGSADAGFVKELDALIAETSAAPDLNSLFTARIIERSRTVKSSCAEQFFTPLAMVAFARFGFLLRRSFFRLMQQDLNATFDGLRLLESQGVSTLDCRKAQFGAEEPITRIRMICQSWRVMFQAEYSSGQPLCLLVDLRTAVESALASGGQTKSAAAAKRK
jgi:hypothetical protein